MRARASMIARILGRRHLSSGRWSGQVLVPAFSDWGTCPELPIARTLAEVVAVPKRRSVCVLEPWEHVGHNASGEEVRASVNVAHVASAMGLDSVCIPLWSAAPALPAKELAAALSGRTLVLEGGAPDVFDASTYTHAECPRSYLFDLYKRLLRSRCDAVFICLSHQMAAACLVELVKEAVAALEASDSVSAKALGAEIRAIGEVICVRKRGQREPVAVGFHDDRFATARNEVVEAAALKLHRFISPENLDGAGAEELQHCLSAHAEYAARRATESHIIEREMSEDSDGLLIAMFHGVEVNYEAVVFAHWALSKLVAARDDVPWLRELPIGVEIVGSTWNRTTDVVITDAACLRIDYDDGHSAFTCQFHPELCGALRDARVAPHRSYHEDDGSRLLRRLLQHLCIE